MRSGTRTCKGRCQKIFKRSVQKEFIPRQDCVRILVLAGHLRGWLVVPGGEAVPVRQSGAGAAEQSVEQGGEEDQEEEGSVQVDGEGLVTEVRHLRLQHALIDRIPDSFRQKYFNIVLLTYMMGNLKSHSVCMMTASVKMS